MRQLVDKNAVMSSGVVVWWPSQYKHHGCIYHSPDGETLHHNHNHANILEEMRSVTLCWAPCRPRSYQPRDPAAVAPPPCGLPRMHSERECSYPAQQMHDVTGGG